MTDPAPRRRSRAPAWILAAASAALLLLSAGALARRIRDFNVLHPRPLFVFREIERREFEFAGRTVTIADHLDDQGRGEVVFTYADDELRLPVQIPSEHELPGLLRHRDWLRVLAFADRTGQSAAEFRRRSDQGEVDARLVVVVREPHAGVGSDPLFDVDVDESSWGWGEVMRRKWTFAFHELLPEGGFRSERLRFPESARTYNRRVAEAIEQGRPVPARDPSEIAERTWQYDAAVAVSPRPPSITQEHQALRNAGWSLPVASASVLTLMLAIAWAVAPERRTE